jgi:hypothetical protein
MTRSRRCSRVDAHSVLPFVNKLANQFLLHRPITTIDVVSE